ncbi:MAG: extracellular solute-binding protein [Pyrinomonadaceae bacterium MAG19_C2-C3]|nr:extracellular solute-binding protein [Pyrinomonadaceae bacterium MAG19_C2-C3]
MAGIIKRASTVFLLASYLVCLTACASSPTKQDAKDGRVTLNFWSATNPTELDFARRTADEWNASHANVRVVVQAVPTGQSSEEIVLAAVASRTTPDIYANASPAEMQNLIDAQGLIRLDDFADFKDAMSARMSPEILRRYQSPDAHFYQVAWKQNPVMVLYNTKILRESGVEKLPVSYSEFLTAANRVSRDDETGRRWMLLIDYLPIWYKRLFDFYPLYLAASDGKTLVDNRQVTFDNADAVAAFDFLRECFARGFVPRQSFQGDAFVKEQVAARFVGANVISYLDKILPADFEYDFAPIPRPDNMNGETVTYADPKSLVVFATCQHPREAWEFVKFMTSRQNDVRLLEMTSQLPVRTRLLEDEAFADYFDSNPKMRRFAEQADSTRTLDSLAETQEIFDIIAGEFEASVLYNTKSSVEAVHDAARRSQRILDVQ